MPAISTRHRGSQLPTAARRAILWTTVGLTLASAIALPDAQRAGLTRRVATVPLLIGYPGFYHGQPVRVSGHLVLNGETAQLFTNEKSLTLLLPTGMSGMDDTRSKAEAAEVTGTFYDVGRTEAGDGRLSGFDLRALSQRLLNKDWPGFGELPVLHVESVVTPSDVDASIRTIALNPDGFADQPVTIVGRFRGRNLFGDLPAAPGKSQWDFVLQSADAAVWVTGQRPRGKDFDLRLDSRVDTGRWLDVTGTVRTDGVRAWVEGTTVRLGTAPPERPAEVIAVPASPPPRVVFSAPVEGEVDVDLGTNIRVQFSREMNPATFKSQVSVAYAASADPGSAASPLVVDASYDEAKRTLILRFRDQPEPLRTVRLSLGPGIVARDGIALAPWILTFTFAAN